MIVMRPIRIYVAGLGPMRGYTDFNFPAFRRAASELRARGYEVFSPAERDELQGFDCTLPEIPPDFSVRDALADDLNWVCRYADIVLLLQGWRASKGALAELHAAWALGISAYEYQEFLDNDEAEEILEVQARSGRGLRDLPAGEPAD